MNVLLIRFSALGDLVTLEPSFRAYRHFFKNDSITLLTSSLGEGLYRDSGYFDKIIVHKSFIDTVKMLRDEYYDVVINLQCTRPSHWMTFLSRKKHLINFSSSMIEKYLHLPSKVKTHAEILVEVGFDAMEVDHFFAGITAIELPYSKKDFSWNSLEKKTIALAPGASERWESKKWGDEKYRALAGRLLEEGYEVILVGASLEKEVGDVIQSAHPKVINMIAKTNLSELKSLLASIDLLICNDSGPAHLAAGVGTDTLTIFGSTDIKHCVVFGKYRGNHNYLVAEPRLECQPCYKSKCPTQHECMQKITVESVCHTAKKLVKVNNAV